MNPGFYSLGMLLLAEAQQTKKFWPLILLLKIADEENQ